MRAVVIALPQGFGVEAAQAEQFGLGPLGHRVEGALRSRAVAGKLGRLRFQQQRQRLVRREFLCVEARLAGLAGVAHAGGDDAARQSLVAPGALARAGRNRDQARQIENKAEHAPQHDGAKRDDSEPHQRARCRCDSQTRSGRAIRAVR